MADENLASALKNSRTVRTIGEYEVFVRMRLLQEGKAAYERHVDRCLDEDKPIYPLVQLTAMASMEPLREGFNTKLVREARLLLCSYILGLEEKIESFKDLTQIQLYILYGLFRIEDYSGDYFSDLVEVYKILCQLQKSKEPERVRHYVQTVDGVSVVQIVTDSHTSSVEEL